MGRAITADYAGKLPVLLGILKGGFVFLADLMRRIDTPCEVQFLKASSYGVGTATSGRVRLENGLSVDIENRHVLVVEDILDSGVTLSYLLGHLKAQNPASLKLCVFLDKTERRQTPITADYVGFACPDAFFVGYGLDYAERYRNLPYIGVLKPEVYSDP
ncbi:MAG: hypoxanthine phosphoribosyltransferase [Oscillospiraceae bacterium]|nr:hypoxanthine phosphoribosyltransferase [Oscillospiraceae bacterium]